MHDISVIHVFDSFQKLFNYSSDLMGLKLLLFFSVLDFFVQCNSFKQFKYKVVFISVLKYLKQTHQVLVM